MNIMRTFIKHGICDGIFCAICYWALGEYSATAFFLKSLHMDCVVLLVSIVLAVLSAYFAFRHGSVKQICVSLFISCVTFVFITALILVCTISLGLAIFPRRPMSNADGFFLLFYPGAFLLISAVARVIALIPLLIIGHKNKGTHCESF